ncbi:MAG: NAD(P)-dependent oxidoreductase [Proteobacteria bacterium]|nr:NAD(P)-dependent oxidoreductase [Pseudomonadota bacterium]
MRIFVTGATGFIGQAAARLLCQRGHQVLGLARDADAARAALPGAAFLPGDLAQPERLLDGLEAFAPEALLHLAWQGLPDYSEFVSQRNVELGLAAFGLAARAGARHIVASGSCWEYASRQGRLSEDAPLRHDQPFPAAKNRLHAEGRAQAREQGLAFTWLRLFFVYGLGQRPASLVPALAAQALAGTAPALRCPANRNDFLHVDDAALAFALALEKSPRAGVYNVGSGSPTGVAEVARMVYAALGREELLGDLDAQAAGGEATEDFWADTARMQADAGFVARIGLGEGIADMTRRFSDMTRCATARPEGERT